jgi:hypothetical protein
MFLHAAVTNRPAGTLHAFTRMPVTKLPSALPTHSHGWLVAFRLDLHTELSRHDPICDIRSEPVYRHERITTQSPSFAWAD